MSCSSIISTWIRDERDFLLFPVSMSDVHGNFYFSFVIGRRQLQSELPEISITRAVESVFIFCMMSTEDFENPLIH